jgi:8-oxo-dGTP diphosphatase
MLTLDLFIHLDAVDRTQWTGSPDDRPLTATGFRQAAYLADQLGAERIDGLFSSPALRCRQSLEPLAQRLGLPIQVLPGFRDTLSYQPPSGWETPDRPRNDPLGGAFSAGSAYAALQEIEARVPQGHAVLCSYGDIVPALLAFLAGLSQTAMPPRNTQKGTCYTVVLADGAVSVTSSDPRPDFPR